MPRTAFRLLRPVLAAAALLTTAAPVFSAERITCTVVLDAESGARLHRDGDCSTRVYPQSTFKLPLAVMGFDAGILKDGATPRLPYRSEYKAPARAQKPVDPRIWLADSIVWYSQVITTRLGMPAFRDYVRRFGYGNGDVSGTPGRDNGLTEAWLMSSLAISADEQAAFVRRLVRGELPVAQSAQSLAMAIVPVFTAGDGWKIHGKTGAGAMRDRAGRSDNNRPIGWFVGWAERAGRRIVFARLLVDTRPYREQPISFAVRDGLIADLPRLAVGPR